MEQHEKYCCGFLRYNTTGAVTYNSGTIVKRVGNCNGYIAINTGNDPVTVADTILYPGVPGTSNGDSKTVGGNAGEIFLGNIRIVFSGIGNAPAVTIEQKFYILDKEIF
jgi:hypothetical protein